ncbi:MAG: alpha-L-fucosidase [Thermoguttaceae bacterium]|jgi:alpha-L-fucosidase
MRHIPRTSAAALLALAMIAMPELSAAERAPAESKAQRDARMQWWREARFGMFIHWGLYSVPAGTYKGRQIGGIGEWIMNNGEIPVAEYAGFAKRFNPLKFDADRWVSIAKNAGMKYIVITSKHHDGFAMFKSNASPYNIVDATPFQRDPLKELAAACRKQGIKLGFYYSQAQDWHHPGGAAYRTGNRKGDHWDPAQDGSMEEYVKKIAVPQVREILSNYGKVAVLWWDTPKDMTKEQIHSLASLLKLQPGIISNNRLGGDEPGDTETPEQFIPPAGYPGRDWETCMTLNDTWGYKSYDRNWKSPETLIRNLIDIASKGGNYLLNVGPTSEGEIPAPSVERLAKVGQWLKVNGEAIYGTTPGPFKNGLRWGRATQKPGRLFLHVFDWPADAALAVPLSNSIRRAYLLADPQQALSVASGPDGISIKVPAVAPDPVASVVVLELAAGDAPQPIASVLQSAADGSLTLRAADADIAGSAQLESKGNTQCIGFWTDLGTMVSWTANCRPGTFEVELAYACDPGSEGSEFLLLAGAAKLPGKIDAATGGWDRFKTISLGKVTLEKGGPTTLAIQPTKKPGMAVMNLQWIKLTPAQ